MPLEKKHSEKDALYLYLLLSLALLTYARFTNPSEVSGNRWMTPSLVNTSHSLLVFKLHAPQNPIIYVLQIHQLREVFDGIFPRQHLPRLLRGPEHLCREDVLAPVGEGARRKRLQSSAKACVSSAYLFHMGEIASFRKLTGPRHRNRDLCRSCCLKRPPTNNAHKLATDKKKSCCIGY